MREKIVRLEQDVARFNGELQSWRLRCDTLDRIADYERKEKEAAQAELSYLRHGAQTTGTDAVPLPPRRHREQHMLASVPQQYLPYVPTPEAEAQLGCGNCASTDRCECAEQAMAIATAGCGKCSVNTHCECLEKTLNSSGDLPVPIDFKRSRSASPSSQAYPEKRHRPSDPTTPLEVDFTTQFSSKPTTTQVQPEEIQIASRRPAESCGFCVEGAYCMCAEAAATANSNNERDYENRLAPLLSEVTPPPSDTDTEMKLPSMHPVQMHRPVATQSTTSPCVNGPGTCQQCQNDPKSGLFCKSLAAMRAAGTEVPDGCCGGISGGGGCCKSLPAVALSQRPPPPSLSCADTYKTLSMHQNFDAASDELNTWLGRLHATPDHHPGRAPMEVEAASVMGVLKLFDRRFGRG